ncbi:MAG: hypothetical protein LBM01_03370 [Christensenellaceae bacterium]|jgi:hypothetical protein|nr:hypothetical protein [Christensenellaceae bacterium]
MSFTAGVCPKCKEYLLLKEGVPFLVCPLCSANISFQKSQTLLKNRCMNPENISKLIEDCLTLEVRYGKELPLYIMGELADNFPSNEEVSYLLCSLTNFDEALTREHLKKFAALPSKPAWAEKLLAACLRFDYLDIEDTLKTYIKTKLDPKFHPEYLAKLKHLMGQYKGDRYTRSSTVSLWAMFAGFAVLNLAVPVVFFVALPMLTILATGLIALGIMLLELGCLFLHNRVFGNRTGLAGVEKVLTVVFVCSIVFLVMLSLLAGTIQI